MTTPKPDTGDTWIAGGVEFISAAAIRRYAAEGRDERWIADRLACNPFFVEKILRKHTDAEIVRLNHVEYLAPGVIAKRLRLSILRVQRVLKAADASNASGPRKPE